MDTLTEIAVDLVAILAAVKLGPQAQQLEALEAFMNELRSRSESRLSDLTLERVRLVNRLIGAQATPDWDHKMKKLETILAEAMPILSELRDANLKGRASLQSGILDIINDDETGQDVQQLGDQAVAHVDDLSVDMGAQLTNWSQLHHLIQELIQEHLLRLSSAPKSEPQTPKGYCEPCRSGFQRLLELGVAGQVDQVPSGVGKCHACGEVSPLFRYQVE